MYSTTKPYESRKDETAQAGRVQSCYPQVQFLSTRLSVQKHLTDLQPDRYYITWFHMTRNTPQLKKTGTEVTMEITWL